MNSSSTCTFLNPVNADGSVAIDNNLPFAFSYTECISNHNLGSTTFTLGEYFNPTTTISSSSDIQVYGYMSSGEVLIAILILLLILLHMIAYMASGLFKIQTGKKYLAYNGGDVEIRKDS